MSSAISDIFDSGDIKGIASPDTARYTLPYQTRRKATDSKTGEEPVLGQEDWRAGSSGVAASDDGSLSRNTPMHEIA